MKTFEIYHYTYRDVCGDSYYGKESKCRTMGFVTDTEENVKSLVDKLNLNNHSFYGKDEPEDEYDDDFCDQDYISYRELEISSIKEIERKYIHTTTV